jgi:hypothetical protein
MSDDRWQAFLVFACLLLLVAVASLITAVFVAVCDGYGLVDELLF